MEEEAKNAKSQELEINYDVDPSLHTESQETGLSLMANELPESSAVTTQEMDPGEEDDDDDDDEDNININIVISDIVNKPYSATQQTGDAATFNRQKSNQAATTATAAGGAAPAANVAAAKAPAKGVDLDAPGLINEQPTFEYDLQEVKDEDKPWRMPGADITDYFNYGFTEETWIQYCMKQKRLRAENSSGYKQFTDFTQLGSQNLAGTGIVPIQSEGGPGGQIFTNGTNGFNNGLGGPQGSFPGNYQNRMNGAGGGPGFQARFPQPQSQNIPPCNFVPRKIGQVGGVDVLSTRPPETRSQMGRIFSSIIYILMKSDLWIFVQNCINEERI